MSVTQARHYWTRLSLPWFPSTVVRRLHTGDVVGVGVMTGEVKTMEIRDAIRKPPITVDVNATLVEAAGLMDAASVGCLVVRDGNQPVGVITDRDITVRAVARGMAPDARVDAVMSTDIITADAAADLRSVMSVFRSHPVRRIPVIDHGNLVGVITLDDLLVDLSADLCDLTRAVTGQVVFGHPEPMPASPVGATRR
jgi:CBS domain-containing protein